MAIGNGYQTGTADPGFYQNQLKNLVSNPGSFSGTPGYQFSFDQAMQGVNRNNSAMRGSGNVMAALQDRASGLASQNYGDYLKTVGGLAGQEQNYDLGLAGANNTAQGNANQFALGQDQNSINRLNANNNFTLGTQQNQNTANRNANDLTLGLGQNQNTANRNANDFSLGQTQNANTLTLGLGQNANTAQRNANDLSLGQGQNANTATRNANDLLLGQGQNANTAQANANNAQNNANNFGLGMYQAGNQFALGQGQNANNAQNNWWNYSLGNQQNQNNYNLGMYNAQTNRGSAQSNAFNNSQNSLLDWTKFGYQLNPGQRTAGGQGTYGGGWGGVY